MKIIYRINHILFFLILGITTKAVAQKGSHAAAYLKDGYKLVWAEEFNEK